MGKQSEKCNKFIGGAFSNSSFGIAIGFIALAIILCLGDIGKQFVIEKIKKTEWSFTALGRDAIVASKITSLSMELRTKIKANRLGIYLFHNGTVFSNGISFKKSSLVYEVTDGVTVPVFALNQSVPLTQMPDVLRNLVIKPGAFYFSTDKISETSLRYSLLADNVKSCYYCRITSGEENLIGYVMLSYIADLPENLDIKRELEDFTGIISSILVKSK